MNLRTISPILMLILLMSPAFDVKSAQLDELVAEALEANPGVPGAVVEYRDLTSDPAATIERVYRDLGLPMSDAYRETLAGEGKRERRHVTRHRYSLEEFGLEGDAIRDRLGGLFERFQWDADELPRGGAASEEAG